MPQETIRRITHPDFSRQSEIAFHHAVRLAVPSGAKLDVLHVDQSPHVVAWEEFPDVRDTLALWGMLPENGDRSIRI